ncbi:MAG: hypothetical protein U0263_30195 [Polyangiaceae bacterium]
MTTAVAAAARAAAVPVEPVAAAAPTRAARAAVLGFRVQCGFRYGRQRRLGHGWKRRLGHGGSGTGGSGTGGSGTGGAGTGGSGTGGTGGGGGNMTPEAFCASYETTCTFSGTDHFTSSQDCKTKYAAFGETQKTCTNTHLGLADSTTSIHCTHAAGQPPCGP